jgi:hypothetical protein
MPFHIISQNYPALRTSHAEIYVRLSFVFRCLGHQSLCIFCTSGIIAFITSLPCTSGAILLWITNSTADIRQVGLLITHLTCTWKFSVQILNGLPTIMAEDFMVFLTHPRQKLEYYFEIGQVSFLPLILNLIYIQSSFHLMLHNLVCW